MATRAAPIREADARRLFKAAKAAGYGEARLSFDPQTGRVELIASDPRQSPGAPNDDDLDAKLDKYLSK